MRYLFVIFALFSLGNILGQHSISGKVVTKNNAPISGAAVYFNNTTIGTTSDTEGNFELQADKGIFTMVVSFLGYKTVEIPVNAANEISFLTITLEEASFMLDEVVVKKETFGEEWQYNLELFKETFLGRTKLAKTCKILNEKDLRFNFDAKTNTLEAYAHRPLKIKHKGLGYLITYDLVEFTRQGKYSFFSGYTQYKNLKKRVRRKWRKNRLKAYNGSRMHFFRSLIAKKVKENGFVVNQFKRIPNPERPSDEKIKWARTLTLTSDVPINFSKKIENPSTQIDSAMVILQKAMLPKYKDILYKSNVPYEDMASYDEQDVVLDFENHLMVIYLNEPEEKNYLKNSLKEHKRQQVQTSNIVLTNGKALLDNSGIPYNANTLINEGYWGFEAFATMLPFNYKP